MLRLAQEYRESEFLILNFSQPLRNPENLYACINPTLYSCSTVYSGHTFFITAFMKSLMHNHVKKMHPL